MWNNYWNYSDKITVENLIWWKKIWINRLSIWIQTLNNDSLTEIWRGNKWDILNALNIINEEWFNNVSIDFIIWLPFVNKWEIKENIDFILKEYLFIKHISVYMLEEYYNVPEDINSKFDNTSNSEIKNIVKLVDNSVLHHKIRPSWSTWFTAGNFNYSPILKFSKNNENWLKYFYIDSKWNMIWWSPKKFEIWKWDKIMIYNDRVDDVNHKKNILTDSVRPFIHWNYLPEKNIFVSILWSKNNFNIKTDWNWEFLFQPNFSLEPWKKYFINFWTNEKNTILQISDTKLIPKIISHKNWDIEVSKRPEFFWNWFPWATVNIKIYNEDQKDLTERECKNILDTDWKKSDLNWWKKFNQTKIFSCNNLWIKWEEKNIISW